MAASPPESPTPRPGPIRFTILSNPSWSTRLHFFLPFSKPPWLQPVPNPATTSCCLPTPFRTLIGSLFEACLFEALPWWLLQAVRSTVCTRGLMTGLRVHTRLLPRVPSASSRPDPLQASLLPFLNPSRLLPFRTPLCRCAATRWSLTNSSEVNLSHAPNFTSKCAPGQMRCTFGHISP